MAKVDYTKTEQLLQEGLLKMSIAHLLHLADVASTVGKRRKNNLINEETISALKKLEHDLLIIKTKDPELFAKLGISDEDLHHLFDSPMGLSPKDWQKLRELFNKTNEIKADLKSHHKVLSNEEIVTAQRKKQKTKRFNVNDKWIPLQ